MSNLLNYILEFLNLKEETSYIETQFEQVIIDKLQYFLLALPSERELRLKLKSIPSVLSNKHDKLEGGK